MRSRLSSLGGAAGAAVLIGSSLSLNGPALVHAAVRWEARTAEVSDAVPGQVVRYDGALVEVVEQRPAATVGRVVHPAPPTHGLAGAAALAVLGATGAALGVFASLRRRRPLVPADAAVAVGAVPTGRYGFDAGKGGLSEEELQRLYGDDAPHDTTATPAAAPAAS